MVNDKIEVFGARVHNLKNIDVSMPRNALIVFTGLSGSGKSSLAFDTIFAEGQRRYIETFSAYARNFLGNMERPDVDKITGLSPVISIEQKTTKQKSTFNSWHYNRDIRLSSFAICTCRNCLFVYEQRANGKIHGRTCNRMILHNYANKSIYVLAPLVRNRKGHYRELFEQMRRKGYLYIRVDGEILEITRGMKVDRYKKSQYRSCNR